MRSDCRYSAADRLTRKSQWSLLEPCLGNPSVLDLVNGDHIDLARTFWKHPRHDFLIDDQIGDGEPVDQTAEKVGLQEPRHMSFSYLSRSTGEQPRRKLVVLAVVGPPLHESVDISGVVGF